MSVFFEVLLSHVKGLVYADDPFIYCSNVSLEHWKGLLQQALRSLSQWCTYWKLLIRAVKCHAISFFCRFGDCETNFFINSGMIGWVPNLKFLGFYFAWRGGNRSHADYFRRKAFKKCNIIKAFLNKRYSTHSQHLVTLVQATVCSLTHCGVGSLLMCATQPSNISKSSRLVFCVWL